MDELVIGLDVGSQGVRALAVDVAGRVRATGAARWGAVEIATDRNEQDPQQWLNGVHEALTRCTAGLDARSRAAVSAIAPTSTSGTLVLTDAHQSPITPAVMWSDTRARREAAECDELLTTFMRRTGLRMRGSFPLPKLMWFARCRPDVLDAAARIMHASDFLLLRLGADEPVTDPTNALKTGYDVVAEDWDPALDDLGVRERLPRVVDSGTVVGTLDLDLASRLGLGPAVRLVTTMTDSNSALLAAGLSRPGQWLTTLGTGLSVKGVAARQLIDPTGAAYCHLDPLGRWLPSGTSHLGAAAVSAHFGEDLSGLEAEAARQPPAATFVYPLVGTGDYFPRWSPTAQGFGRGSTSRAGEFRATLEGVAAVEELAYRRFRQLGADVGAEISAVGGATNSDLWTMIRASVQNRTIRVLDQPETAVGAAVQGFAALGYSRDNIAASISARSHSVDPDPALVAAYEGFVDRYEEELDRHAPIEVPGSA
jgi:D-ribulokinase